MSAPQGDFLRGAECLKPKLHFALSSSVPDKLLGGQTNVFGDLAQEDRRYITTHVKRHRSRTSIRMTELLVRAALAHFNKTQRNENCNDLAGL